MIEEGQAERVNRYVERLREIASPSLEEDAFLQLAELSTQHLKAWEAAATEEYRELLNQKIQSGYIRIELCGHLEDASLIKGFTLDKTKYRMRLVDETEESVRVVIEPKESVANDESNS